MIFIIQQQGSVLRWLFAFALLLGCSSCQLLSDGSSSTGSRTDVRSSLAGGPSAETSLSFFSTVLADEAAGKPCCRAWGSYRSYWIGRMNELRKHESAEYYQRVFGDFEATRARLGLSRIPVIPYSAL